MNFGREGSGGADNSTHNTILIIYCGEPTYVSALTLTLTAALYVR